MRYVAVTDGDKVEAEDKFGYSGNTHGIGDLVRVIGSVSDKAVNDLVAEYADSYSLAATLPKGNAPHQALREAAKIETGPRAFLEDGNFKGFSDTFKATWHDDYLV